MSCQVEAERGAQAVQVEYLEDPSLGAPLLSIAEAIKADSYYDPPMDLVTTIGDAKTAMKTAQYAIQNARWGLIPMTPVIELLLHLVLLWVLACY